MTVDRSRSIVVVGGGVSGSLTAAQLLARARTPVHITIVDASGRFGEGVAYHTRHPEHFLNVRAKSMSAAAGDPDHFVRWLAGAGRDAAARWGVDSDPDAFLPRGLYAEYAAAVLDSAETGATPGTTLERIRGEAVAVESLPDGARVTLRDGRSLPARAIVLALGNPHPAHPTEQVLPFYKSDRYVQDPWSDRALEHLPADATILVVGTGLTMIDVAVALARVSHRGKIHAVSRRGLLPQEHRRVAAAPEFLDPERSPRSIRALLRATRDRIESAGRDDVDWRSVFDTLRPHVARFWLGLPGPERRRFLQHLRPYWDIHRHRAAPANMRDIDRMQADGQLVVRAGRIRGFSEIDGKIEVSLLPRGGSGPERIRVERVINATGPESDYRKVGSPLVDQLLQDRLVRPGPFGYGLDATPEGVLLDSSGRSSRFLSALGPPLRGVLWETTAVPEIREQAAALAARLIAATPDVPR